MEKKRDICLHSTDLEANDPSRAKQRRNTEEQHLLRGSGSGILSFKQGFLLWPEQSYEYGSR